MNLEALPNHQMSSCPERLLQALRSQLMHYTRNPSPSVAGNIVDCLDKLIAHPQFKAPRMSAALTCKCGFTGGWWRVWDEIQACLRYD